MSYTDVKAQVQDHDGDVALLPVVCDTCGALVADQRLHDEFHAQPMPKPRWPRRTASTGMNSLWKTLTSTLAGGEAASSAAAPVPAPGTPRRRRQRAMDDAQLDSIRRRQDEDLGSQ